MKSLKTLIKIHRHQLDELRRDMASLESKKNGLEHGITRLQNELDNEVRLAEAQIEVRGYLGDFVKRVNERQALLREDIQKVEGSMEALRIQISEAFSEVKKYEIALENAQKRKAGEEKRKETIEMGDIAIEQYQRRKDNSDA